MRSLAISLILYVGIAVKALAGQLEDTLTAEDISKSIARIQSAYEVEDATDRIISKEDRTLGKISFKQKDAYVTFGYPKGLEIFDYIMPPTKGNPLELIDAGFDLQGHGHKGLTQLFQDLDAENSILPYAIKYKEGLQNPSENIRFVIEGFGPYAHLATITALSLKQHPATKDYLMILLRYDAAKTFDEQAVQSIQSMLSRTLILDFNVRDDESMNLWGFPNISTYLGYHIEFSASDSPTYRDRVEKLKYTNLDPSTKDLIKAPITGLLMVSSVIKKIKPIKEPGHIFRYLQPHIWEMHQPITYAELCPLAFDKLKKKTDLKWVE